MSGGVILAATSPVVRGVRMFVAPVQAGVPVVFDPAAQGGFAVSAPPAGWLAVGNVLDVTREAETGFAEVWSGAPAVVKTRARQKVAAGVSCTFTAWSKLALLLSTGAQGMNLLRTAATGGGATVVGGGATGSGGTAEAAMPVLAGSSATVLVLAAGSKVNVGDAVVVDTDYAGATGAIGSGVAGMFLQTNTAETQDVDYVRRVSLNVARVAAVAVTAGAATMTVTLAAPLLAGVPAVGMKLAVLLGFTDRLGGSYAPEWSALFAMDGVQGDRILVHYPRLQSAPGTAEVQSAVAAGLERWRLRANFHALPVTDPNDGEAVLCFRSYLPAPMRAL